MQGRICSFSIQHLGEDKVNTAQSQSSRHQEKGSTMFETSDLLWFTQSMYAPTSSYRDVDTNVTWAFTYYKLGRMPRTTFSLAVLSFKPRKIAKGHSKSECISALKKN